MMLMSSSCSWFQNCMRKQSRSESQRLLHRKRRSLNHTSILLWKKQLVDNLTLESLAVAVGTIIWPFSVLKWTDEELRGLPSLLFPAGRVDRLIRLPDLQNNNSTEEDDFRENPHSTGSASKKFPSPASKEENIGFCVISNQFCESEEVWLFYDMISLTNNWFSEIATA